VTVQPVDLTQDERGALAPTGAVYVEKDRRLNVPMAYGEAVVSAVSRVLDAILTVAVQDPS
jgi:hypothetical protein